MSNDPSDHLSWSAHYPTPMGDTSSREIHNEGQADQDQIHAQAKEAETKVLTSTVSPLLSQTRCQSCTRMTVDPGSNSLAGAKQLSKFKTSAKTLAVSTTEASTKSSSEFQPSPPESPYQVNNEMQAPKAAPTYSFLQLDDIETEQDKPRPVSASSKERDTITATTLDQPEPIYIDGDITTFPRSLIDLIKRFRKRDKKLELPCSRTMWPYQGEFRRTLYDLPGGKRSQWSINNTSKMVHVGRFKWGLKRQLIVAQHSDYNNGRACLIQCTGTTQIAGAPGSRWVIWDPFQDCDEENLIVRTAKDARATADPSITASGQNASVDPTQLPDERVETETDSASTQSSRTPPSTPQKSLVVSLKVPGLSRLSTPQASAVEPGVSPQPLVVSRNRLSLASTLFEFPEPVDLLSEQRSLSATNISDTGETQQRVTTNLLMAPPVATQDSARGTLTELERPQQTQPLVSPGARQSEADQPLHSLPIPSITSTTATKTATLSVDFAFKETQLGPILRQRPYSKCKSVKMLYAQAVSAGIADQETTLLFVQVAKQNPRTVVKDDAEDYNEVKAVIEEEIEKVKGDTETIKVIEVIVFPFLWSDF